MADLPATIGDEVLRRLYQYWDAKRAGRRFPARSDIDPTELSYALGWLNLIDVLHDPLRFRYRLQGTMLVRHTGIEMTGKFLDEHPQPEFRRHLARSWQKIVESGEPEHELHDQYLDETAQRFESLRLPLSSDGNRVDMLILAIKRWD
jgi:hypothetical protein